MQGSYIFEMMKQKECFKISIIMPVWNAEKYLERSIASVKNQTYQNWELIIVDDGSDDNSISICEKESRKDLRIKLICNEHGGTALARNTGIKEAEGDYIGFLDADDVFHPMFFEKMINAVIKNKTDIALCRTVRGTDATEFCRQVPNVTFDVETNEEVFKRMYQGQWPDLIAPYTKIYKRYIFDRVSFPEGRYFEDAATMNLAIYYGNKVSVTDTAMYFYNITPNSSSVTKRSCELLDREWALRSHWEFYLKENRIDLVYMAMPFYLAELISIYHRIENSDCPEDGQIIRKRFEDTYKKYSYKIVLTEKQKNQILAFRYPTLYDIRNMIRKDGIVYTVIGFIKRKLIR